jgi:hypothetical protein
MPDVAGQTQKIKWTYLPTDWNFIVQIIFQTNLIYTKSNILGLCNNSAYAINICHRQDACFGKEGFIRETMFVARGVVRTKRHSFPAAGLATESGRQTPRVVESGSPPLGCHAA